MRLLVACWPVAELSAVDSEAGGRAKAGVRYEVIGRRLWPLWGVMQKVAGSHIQILHLGPRSIGGSAGPNAESLQEAAMGLFSLHSTAWACTDWSTCTSHIRSRSFSDGYLEVTVAA